MPLVQLTLRSIRAALSDTSWFTVGSTTGVISVASGVGHPFDYEDRDQRVNGFKVVVDPNYKV